MVNGEKYEDGCESASEGRKDPDLKENIQINLFIDFEPSAHPDFMKWISFIQKYLVYGMEQKGIKVKLLSAMPSSEDTDSSEKSNLVYLPVFAGNNSMAYLEKVKAFYELREASPLLKIGLLKESEATDLGTGLFSELKLIKMYLIDTDNGYELGDQDLWKKENFNLLLFKIVDLSNELATDLKNLHQPISVQDSNSKGVYLAEATPDLISVREEVRRELLRQGFEVYPNKPVTGNAKEVEKTILDFLQKSVLSIHLFGKLYQEAKAGEVPRAELENKLAAHFYLNKKESKKSSPLPFRRIIWLPDHLMVSNEKQMSFLETLQKDKKLYAGSDMIRSSVEELKDIILEKLTEKLQKMAGLMIVQKKLAAIKDCLRTD